jgi:hypothetical protein
MFNWLFRGKSACRPAKAPQLRSRLQLEELETRSLLSASATGLILGPTPPLDTHAVFRIHQPHLLQQGGIEEDAAALPEASQGTNSSPGAGPDTSQVSVSPGAFVGSPLQVSSLTTVTTTGPEAEEHIAVSPANSSTLVSAISDFSLRGGYNTTKYAVSLNNGTTWTEAFVPLVGGAPATSDGKVWGANSDPVVAISKTGTVYLADLYFSTTNSDNSGGFYVSTGTINSSTGAISFTQSSTRPVLANLDPGTSNFEDKEWIAVDNSSAATSGNVYVSWTHFVGNNDWIDFSRSTNGGLSWSAPVQVSLPAQNGAVQGSQVAVGPNGEVYLAYEVFFVGGQRKLYLTKSTNGGQSFSSPVAITPYFSEPSFNSTYRKDSFPSLAVGPEGNVYVAYAAQLGKGRTSSTDVEFIYSTNGGASFSSAVTLNQVTTGQQFFPALAVDQGTGAVYASWFDTRNSSSARYYDVYASKITLSGGTLSVTPNTRVTTSLLDSGGTDFIGDYAGIAAGGGFAHPVWTSGGFNGGKLQTATLQ